MKLKLFKNSVRLTLLFILVPLAASVHAADLSIFHAEPPESSSRTFDHSEWSDILSKYISELNGLNYFRYGQVTEDDFERLEDYIEDLESVAVTELDADQQFAYWVNLYNALTVWVILEHYPVDSIRDISFSLLTRGPWKEEFVSVQDVDLTLDNIEHDILRPVYEDNRIHYAVNCASIGCPNLQNVAFTAENLEEQLEKAAREYVNHPRGARIEDDELIVSSIYDWYREDFGDSEIGVIEHLLEYASGELAEELQEFDEIDDYEYDWRLNE